MMMVLVVIGVGDHIIIGGSGVYDLRLLMIIELIDGDDG